ncbi:MAG TPA: YebC/PmpR family DNA-binding transcriptional regulator [Chthonomonadales bacterium]|nr:YebC/PmpR family DNA-binding transcriptional regulator [Chthonomonadales bacterium]
MSGHSKWHNIRLRKGRQDAERGALFTKLAREIIIAAKQGGGNPDGNARLRLAMQKARDSSMPQDRIQNAVRKGTGELEGAVYEELTYEGYGPGGVAVIVQCATDNRNRTVADVRKVFSKSGGRLGENGSVAWMFSAPVGLISVSSASADEDSIMAVALDAGATDMRTGDGCFEVTTQPGDLARVTEALQEAGAKVESAEVTILPNQTVHVDGKEAQQVLRLMELLEDLDDVQRVHANFDIPEEVLEAAAR